MARSRFKTLFLVTVPLPIVIGSVTLANWARLDPMTGATRNTVHDLSTFGHASDLDSTRFVAEVAGNNEKLARQCEDTVVRLSQRLCKDEEFLVRTPFVLGGNLSQVELDEWYRKTVLPAFQAMCSTYFEAIPDAPISILMFQNATSYRDFSRKLLGHRNVSLYGYYRPATRMVVVNMGAGAGTIVHELTHALIDFDFPEVPLWFNEGLASLHEECQLVTRDGQPAIQGVMNWRFPILLKAIQSNSLPSLLNLIQDEQIRGDNEAINYAMARYICMFLQDRGSLRSFYRRLRDHFRVDPTGKEALQESFSGKSWDLIDFEFQSWARQLAD